jgi:hypothetical protein
LTFCSAISQQHVKLEIPSLRGESMLDEVVERVLIETAAALRLTFAHCGVRALMADSLNPS